jgi:hypothetical protein
MGGKIVRKEFYYENIKKYNAHLQAILACSWRVYMMYGYSYGNADELHFNILKYNVPVFR